MPELRTSTAHSDGSDDGRAIDAVIVQIPYEMCGALITELDAIVRQDTPMTALLLAAVNNRYTDVMTDEAIARFAPPSETDPAEDTLIQRGFVMGYLKAKGVRADA